MLTRHHGQGTLRMWDTIAQGCHVPHGCSLLSSLSLSPCCHPTKHIPHSCVFRTPKGTQRKCLMCGGDTHLKNLSVGPAAGATDGRRWAEVGNPVFTPVHACLHLLADSTLPIRLSKDTLLSSRTSVCTTHLTDLSPEVTSVTVLNEKYQGLLSTGCTVKTG